MNGGKPTPKTAPISPEKGRREREKKHKGY
jgi:hypothetical protein